MILTDDLITHTYTHTHRHTHTHTHTAHSNTHSHSSESYPLGTAKKSIMSADSPNVCERKKSRNMKVDLTTCSRKRTFQLSSRSTIQTHTLTHTQTHTLMVAAAMQGAILGSVSCSRILRHAAGGTRKIKPATFQLLEDPSTS